ncbi:undecaprenyl-diphosphate phosphatase [Halobacillus trueperi]|uniref:undecaprenyl-diphosphate phosphatase n=1 Tax=Halobacillus trueperi TaxID=156205 RepID=UPI00373564E0
MEMIEFIKVVILGMFEGLTEFAPVSSTGHMILVDEMWLKTDLFLGDYVANTFKVFIQLGSILAVVVIFRDRFRELVLSSQKSRGFRLKWSHIITGLLPAAILGFLFEDFIDEHLFTLETVLIGLGAGAVFMIAADLHQPKEWKESVDQISHRQAFTIGMFQCLSLWPGFSRSGATISAGVLMGLSHRAAADFTFIMAVPIMLGASSLSIVNNLSYFQWTALPYFAVGFLSAFLFALLSIRFFLKLINHVKLIPFAIYRFLLIVGICFLYY